MSPENDFNVYRVESLGQIAGLKPAGQSGQRKRREKSSKKRSGQAQESVEQTEQPPQPPSDEPENVDANPDDEHSIDYQA